MGDIEVLKVVYYYLIDKVKEKYDIEDDIGAIDKMKGLSITPILLNVINF